MAKNYVGLAFGSWTVVRDLPSRGHLRRVECTCSGCGTTTSKWISNLIQNKHGCGVCVPHRARTAESRANIVKLRLGVAKADAHGRLCMTCGEKKTWSSFSSDKRRIGGKTSNCTSCSGWRTMSATYGITKEEWFVLKSTQHGVCALCFEPDDESRRLSVDHDHSHCGSKRACKKCIRGLLCGNCNRMMGFVEKRMVLRGMFVTYLNYRPFVVLGDVSDNGGTS